MNITYENNALILKSENGRLNLSIRKDGTVVISSMDSVQLTGAGIAKLDNAASPEAIKTVLRALEKTI
jgi:hypothetical protein